MSKEKKRMQNNRMFRPRNFFAILALIFTIIAFQNCAPKSGQFEDLSSVQSTAFFAYPYSSAPTYYSDMSVSVISDATATGGLLSLQIMAMIRNVADLTASTPYQLQIEQVDGSLLCPTATGTATPTVTTISVSCVTPIDSPHVLLILTLGSGANQQVMQKQF